MARAMRLKEAEHLTEETRLYPDVASRAATVVEPNMARSTFTKLTQLPGSAATPTIPFVMEIDPMIRPRPIRVKHLIVECV